jgi:hypothetical protein
MKSVRKRVTYANVMSSIAVFFVVAGGTAFAASQLGKESVGTSQLKKEAVSLAKIKKAAKNSLKGATGPQGSKGERGATGAQGPKGEKGETGPATGPAGGVLTGNYPNPGLAANSVTGANVQQGTLSQVKAANVYGVTYAETGTGAPKIITASDPAIKSGGCFLACSVEFPVDVSECSATVSSTGIGNSPGVGGSGESLPSGNPNTIIVAMYDKEGALTAHNFTMTVVCPKVS